MKLLTALGLTAALLLTAQPAAAIGTLTLRSKSVCLAVLKKAQYPVEFAQLQRCDLRGANLRNRYFQLANLRGSNLRGSNLRGFDFSGADFALTDFSGADLRGADFTGANIWGTTFYRCDLRGADFSGALDDQFFALGTLGCGDWRECGDPRSATEENFSSTANLTGAIMPDGTIHD